MITDEEKGEIDQLELTDPLQRDPNKDQPKLERPHLNQQQQKQLGELLGQYEDVFSEEPGSSSIATHHIRTGEVNPIHQHPYRIPAKWQKALEEEVNQLLTKGLISKSESPWTAPVVCVRKKDNSLRMCVDFRKLNSVTADDVYPIPRIEEIIDALAEAQYISTIDLTKGYYQIPVAKEDRCKTAFITPAGKFEFNRMPFGLKGAPATFQRAMDSLLMDCRLFAASYIDDTIIFSKSWEQHLDHLKEVLQKLRQAGLTAKMRKCIWAARECSFLGHVVGRGRVRPERAKIAAVQEFAQPRTKKDIRSFLGLAGYYRRFLPEFSSTSAVLSDLTRKDQPDKITWTHSHQKAFDNIKAQLAEEPMLWNPDPNKPFTLHTDASNRGVGAVLSQEDKQGALKPVAFYSRKFLPREQRYTATQQECLAVVNAIKHFEVYLLGNKFTVVTDHGALKHLSTIKYGGARVTRWVLALQPFEYTVQHRPGIHNGNADGLSRQAWEQEDTTQGSAPKKEGGVSGTSSHGPGGP